MGVEQSQKELFEVEEVEKGFVSGKLGMDRMKEKDGGGACYGGA